MLPDPIQNLAGPTARQLDVVEQQTSLGDSRRNISSSSIISSSSSSSNNNKQRRSVGPVTATSCVPIEEATRVNSPQQPQPSQAPSNASPCPIGLNGRSVPLAGKNGLANGEPVRPGRPTGARKRTKKSRRWSHRPDAMGWEYDYLSREQLTGFDNYKLVPRSIAPNCLTFGGFLLNLVSLCLLSWYDFSFFASSDEDPNTPPVPRWVWLVCAFNQFMAHTLDGIDGKHARRTGLSGPMGELFDHGLDSWATLFMPVCVFSVFGRMDYAVSPWRYYLILWDVHYCFLTSHWEKYNTGVLFLPWGYDVSQIFLTVTFLLTYFFGHSMWKFDFLGLPSGNYMEATLHFGAAGLGLPVSLWNIYNGYKAKTLRHYSWWEGSRPLVAPTVFFVLTTIWVVNSPTQILDNQPRVMFVMIGTLFANIATRLIINQMTGTRCDLLNGMLSMVVATLFCVFGLRWNETYCLYGLTLGVLIGHVHYATCVVRQMCEHFNIYCFSVERRPPPKKVE